MRVPRTKHSTRHFGHLRILPVNMQAPILLRVDLLQDSKALAPFHDVLHASLLLELTVKVT